MTNYTGGMNQVLDTYQAVKELVSSGFAEEQAEAIVSLQVRFLNENMATKQDIALIQHDIEAQRLATQKDIEGLRAETKKDIESLRAETQQSFAAVHKDIEIIHKEIESLRAETKKDIESLRVETQKDIAGVQKEIKLSEGRLTLKMGGMLVAAIGALVSLQTFAG